MAVYKLFPSKDASIYSFYPTMNTGIDPIMEIGNLNVNYDPRPQVFRFLVKFDQNEIEDVIDNKVEGTQFSSSLKCFIAQAQGVVMETNLEVYPISGSWNNGSGTYLDSPLTTNGVSWRWRTFEDGIQWDTDGTYPTYVTASWSGSNNIGGANWYTGSDDPYNTVIAPTQTFDLRTTKDININSTDIVKVWYSSSKSIGGYTNITNEGFIAKWEDAIEFSTANALQPIMQFYSVDTNTIYPPTLEIKWDDSSYSTDLTEISTTDLFVSLDNNPGTFYSQSVNKFRLNVRPEFPARVYQTASLYTTNFALPQESYYAVKDLDTNEFIIDFDEKFTKISCDDTSNYFTLYMNGFEPERYYKILIKTTINGSTIVKDENYYFKIVNG